MKSIKSTKTKHLTVYFLFYTGQELPDQNNHIAMQVFEKERTLLCLKKLAE